MVEQNKVKRGKSAGWYIMLVALAIFGFILAYFIPTVIRNPTTSNILIIAVIAAIEVFIFYKVVME